MANVYEVNVRVNDRGQLEDRRFVVVANNVTEAANAVTSDNQNVYNVAQLHYPGDEVVICDSVKS